MIYIGTSHESEGSADVSSFVWAGFLDRFLRTDVTLSPLIKMTSNYTKVKANSLTQCYILYTKFQYNPITSSLLNTTI